MCDYIPAPPNRDRQSFVVVVDVIGFRCDGERARLPLQERLKVCEDIIIGVVDNGTVEGGLRGRLLQLVQMVDEEQVGEQRHHRQQDYELRPTGDQVD